MTKTTMARRAWLVTAAMMSTAMAFCGLTAPTTFADESTGSIKSGQNSVTVTYEHEDKPVADSNYYLYQVAEWNGEMPMYDHLTLTPMFQKYEDEQGINISGMLKPSGCAVADTDAAASGDAAASDDAAATTEPTEYELASLCWDRLNSTLFQTLKVNGEFYGDNLAKRIEAGDARTAETDANGQVTFSNLGDGVFFLVSPIDTVPELVYSAQLVSLPSAMPASEEARHLSVKAKPNLWAGVDPIHVKKVWKNDDPATRPKSVTVELYLNLDNGIDEMVLIDTVELNESNGWEYDWDKLPEYMDYSVREKDVPGGYKVTVTETKDGPNTAYFTLTNTKPAVPPVTPPTPSVPEKPAQTGANVALIALVAVASCFLALLLIVEARRVAKNKQ